MANYFITWATTAKPFSASPALAASMIGIQGEEIELIPGVFFNQAPCPGPGSGSVFATRINSTN